MKRILALEVFLLTLALAWLAWPDAPTINLDDYIWRTSVLAVKSVPLLIIGSLVYLAVRVFPRHLERQHEIHLARAYREAPEGVTHYTAPRLTHNSHYGTRTLPPADLPALPMETRPLSLMEWYPTCVQHSAHILLVGETQSSKSTLARVLLTARATTDQVIVIDPHAKFNDWLGVPVYGVGCNIDKAVQAIYAIHREFERRFQAGEAVNVGLSVFIDEFPALAKLRKEIVPLVQQWLRESAKAKIRLVMLTQEPNAKTLGVEGEAAIKQNFLHILLGSYAARAHTVAATLPRPAAMVRCDQDPLPLDVTGLPDLIRDDVPPVAVWQPATSTSSTEARGLPEVALSGKKKQRFSAEQIAEIHARKAVGESKTRACREMFGTTGGNTWYSFQEVWDEDGY